MNRHQSRKSQTFTTRRLPALELRPGMTLTLGRNSAQDRVLPQTVGQCVGGSYATVTAVDQFGDALRVRASQDGRILTFVAPADQRVIARIPDAVPVPFTPLGWAVMLGIPGAAEMAIGTSYAAA